MTFTILAVCTGNICRSPVAEYVLAQRMSDVAEVSVQSAGVGALVGHGVADPAQLLAADLGLDMSEHVARQLDVSLIRKADLILAMARDHRRHVVEATPTALRRTFTIRELARIADVAQDHLTSAITEAGAKTPDEALRAAVAVASAIRGTVPPPERADEFDVIDPYGRGISAYQQSFTELIPAAERVAAFLTRTARLVSGA